MILALQSFDEQKVKIGKPFVADLQGIKPTNSVFITDVVYLKGKVVDGEFIMDDKSLKLATMADRGLIEYLDSGNQLLLDFYPNLSLLC